MLKVRMYNTRHKNEQQIKSRKEKRLRKLINKSDSDGYESEHELSFYVKDRVKLMKQVLSIIKPKKIKSMAPDCIKNMEIEEINSMLLEELLGISSKRLKYIFEGKNLEEDSSSTEEDKSPDVISLDDISDDDFIIEINSDDEPKANNNRKHTTIKGEPRSKEIKKEKSDKGKQKEPMGEENLMSVLELLELQARARAIRSQLALEASRKEQEENKILTDSEKRDDEEDAVIVEVPKEEIVITSSESENEDKAEKLVEVHNKVGNNCIDIDNNIDNKEQDKTNLENIPIASTINKTEDTNRSENERHSLLLEESERSNKNKKTGSDQQSEDNQKVETENLKEIRLHHFKSEVESLKKDVIVEDKCVKIIESIVIKPQDSSSHKSRDDDGLVINVDQDDIDCIISD